MVGIRQTRVLVLGLQKMNERDTLTTWSVSLMRALMVLFKSAKPNATAHASPPQVKEDFIYLLVVTSKWQHDIVVNIRRVSIPNRR